MLIDLCKSHSLGLYYYATLPKRWQNESQWREKGCAPCTVLFYHRVADDHPNAWSISLKQFKHQIEWVRERYQIVSLADVQQAVDLRQNTEPLVAITFDDGYADNSEAALPWLLQEGLPLTYFVTTGNMSTGEPFPHDVRAGTPLRPNTPEQIRELAASGVEIGCHTRTHADLGSGLPDRALRDEIVGSKRDLEDLIGRQVRYFAFPFGMPENMTTTGFRIAREAGLSGVCSAYGAYNVPGSDSFHIRRVHGDPEWGRFRNWLTVDPRKVQRQEPFDPGDYRTPAILR